MFPLSDQHQERGVDSVIQPRPLYDRIKQHLMDMDILEKFVLVKHYKNKVFVSFKMFTFRIFQCKSQFPTTLIQEVEFLTAQSQILFLFYIHWKLVNLFILLGLLDFVETRRLKNEDDNQFEKHNCFVYLF